MFSLALKNAILLILIILIIHVLLKNMMLKKVATTAESYYNEPPALQVKVEGEQESQHEDEHELYNYLYKKEPVPSTHSVQPVTIEYEAASIGNFSKFADFASI